MVPFCCYVVLPVFDILHAISSYVAVCNPPEVELQEQLLLLSFVGIEPVRLLSVPIVLPRRLDPA